MLVEMAVADAYAIAWEFTKDQMAPVDLAGFHSHPTYVELKPGQYTDDTQRSIANINVMLSWNHTDVYDPMMYAQAYISAYQADPREGYSRGYQAFIGGVDGAADFLSKIQANKLSNGSVMGVAPLGFLRTVAEVKLASKIQAITTHHPETATDAQVVALAVHYFVHLGGSREGLLEWLLENVDWVAGARQQLEFVEAVERYEDLTAKTTIKARSISAYMAYAVPSLHSLTDIIKDAVERGGDTDSAAAVAVAVASLTDVTNDIPQHLVDAMDAANPNFGVDFLGQLEHQLRTKFSPEDR